MKGEVSIMTKETLKLIHRSYQEALEMSENILETVQNLYNILDELEVAKEDSSTFDSFLDGLRGCINSRKKTFEITNMITYVNITFMYIILWLNKTQNVNIDINWYSRLKSLESELSKLLRKSNSNLSANIRDRFGLRGILLNNDSDEVVKDYIYLIFDAISGIVAAKNRKARKEFIEWIDNNNGITDIDKSIIEQVLKIPFYIDYVKDFIHSPKPNNYQSLQFTMAIQMYSEVLPGCQFEVQLRSMKMHEEAVYGTASHENYKKYREDGLQDEDPILKVFCVDDFSKVHVKGFSSYDSQEHDKAGIHFANKFSYGRISTTLVPH